MRSSEPDTRLRGLATTLVIAASVGALSCVPMPAASQPATAASNDCSADDQAAQQRVNEASELRRAVEMGPFYAIASRAGRMSCRISYDTDSIRIDYGFRDGASLRVTRTPAIEYTDLELRLASPLVEDPTTVLTRAEQAAFGASGCAINWRQPETAPADDDSRATERVYRGEVCNCQARTRTDAAGRIMRLQFRSAC